jgi:hypothetical protein
VFNTPDPSCSLDDAEIIARLREAGFGKLLDGLADEKVYTKLGRLNVAALGRTMRMPANSLDKLLKRAHDAAKSLSGAE